LETWQNLAETDGKYGSLSDFKSTGKTTLQFILTSQLIFKLDKNQPLPVQTSFIPTPCFKYGRA
jgi:hypothetical protein